MGHFWIFGPCLMSLVYDCPPFVARETHWSHREVAVATNCCDTHGLSRRLRSEDSQKSGGEAVAMRSSNSEIPCRWCKILFVTLKDDRRVPYLSSQSSQQLFRCWLKPYIAIIFASQLASRFRQQPLLELDHYHVPPSTTWASTSPRILGRNGRNEVKKQAGKSCHWLSSGWDRYKSTYIYMCVCVCARTYIHIYIDIWYIYIDR